MPTLWGQFLGRYFGHQQFNVANGLEVGPGFAQLFLQKPLPLFGGENGRFPKAENSSNGEAFARPWR